MNSHHSQNIVKALVIFSAITLATSCKKKEESADIYIAPKADVEEVSNDNSPRIVGDNTASFEIEWVGNYTCDITRQHIESDIITDANGHKYYNNAITMTVKHDGQAFFTRRFTQADFNNYVDATRIKNSESILASIVYKDIEEGNAIFMATIGDPNPDSEAFVSVRIAIDKNGGMSMKSMKSMNGDDEGTGSTDATADELILDEGFVED